MLQMGLTKIMSMNFKEEIINERRTKGVSMR